MARLVLTVFILGHVGLTAAVVETLRRRWPAFARLPLAWVAVGALLPDLVDKPVGHVLLDLGNGRLVAHSLLFALVLAGLALALHRAARPRAAGVLAALSFGSAAHLVFDQMWEIPGTLLWPALGWAFPHLGFEPLRWVDILFTDRFVQVTEVLGALGGLWALRSRHPGWHLTPGRILLREVWQGQGAGAEADPVPGAER